MSLSKCADLCYPICVAQMSTIACAKGNFCILPPCRKMFSLFCQKRTFSCKKPNHLCYLLALVSTGKMSTPQHCVIYFVQDATSTQNKTFQTIVKKSLPRSPWTPRAKKESPTRRQAHTAWPQMLLRSALSEQDTCCLHLQTVTAANWWQTYRIRNRASVCVRGVTPPERKGSVSVATPRHKNRKGNSHNFLWWHAYFVLWILRRLKTLQHTLRGVLETGSADVGDLIEWCVWWSSSGSRSSSLIVTWWSPFSSLARLSRWRSTHVTA